VRDRFLRILGGEHRAKRSTKNRTVSKWLMSSRARPGNPRTLRSDSGVYLTYIIHGQDRIPPASC